MSIVFFTNRIAGTYHLVQYAFYQSSLLSIICRALLNLNKDDDSNTVFSIETTAKGKEHRPAQY